jgi:hypothetical protein
MDINLIYVERRKKPCAITLACFLRPRDIAVQPEKAKFDQPKTILYRDYEACKSLETFLSFNKIIRALIGYGELQCRYSH